MIERFHAAGLGTEFGACLSESFDIASVDASGQPGLTSDSLDPLELIDEIEHIDHTEIEHIETENTNHIEPENTDAEGIVEATADGR